MKAILINTTCAILTVLICMSCGHSKSMRSMEKYLSDPDHGLIKTRKVSEFKIELKFMPSELLVAKELKNADHLSPDEAEKMRNSFNSNLYFILTLQYRNNDLTSMTKNRAEYGQIIDKLSFGMAPEVLATCSAGDTIGYIDYMYNRIFGISQSTDLLFVFKKPDFNNCGERILFTLHEFGLGTGDINFKMETKDIEKVSQYTVR